MAKEKYLQYLDDSLHRIQAELRGALLALRQTQHAYGHFVPKDFLELLGTKNIANVNLGDHVEMKTSILFADLRNFTSVAEELRSDETFRTLNKYLAQFESPIHSHRGVIDKFLGDGTMAIFRAADDAVTAGISMLERVDSLNHERVAESLKPIALGIGINTGYSSLGVIGNADRMETTVIGDAVNVASRIQDLTKQFGSKLLISETTHLNLDDESQFSIRFIGRIRVKGRLRPVSIYEVFDTDSAERKEAKVAGLDLFQTAVAHFHLGNFDEAQSLLQQYTSLLADDPIAEYYLDRCRNRATHDARAGDPERSDEFSWARAYDTGHSLIDEHHHHLVDIYANLKEAVKNPQRDSVAEVLEDLEEYTRFHFSAEEDLMRETKYPLMPDHVGEHRHFSKRLAQLSLALKNPDNNPQTLIFWINIFLFDWLAAHSSRIDRHLARYIDAGHRGGKAA